jgi:outer membrane protein OmpA-like peptidoglycan-associated protein
MNKSLCLLGAGILLAASGCVSNAVHVETVQKLDDATAKIEELAADLKKKDAELVSQRANEIRTVKSVAILEDELRNKYALSVKPAPELGIDHKIDGSKAVLGGTAFKAGSVDLDEKAQKFLDQLVPQLKDDKVKYVEIVGHTDNTKPAAIKTKLGIETNLVLGVRRAEKVAEYLISKGVPETKLIVSSMGQIHNERKVEVRAFGG